MLKLYHEHAEFDSFTRFDTATGRLDRLTEQEFRSHLPPSSIPLHAQGPTRRIEHDGKAIFLGETPEDHVRFPRRIYFQITRRCNLSCSYCFIKAKRGDSHVPVSAIAELAEYCGRNGLMEVRLTGGEPTTHPDFLRIMRKFKAEGVYVSVATNGVWSPEILEALCEEAPLWIIASVDGERATHNRYRDGTFDTVMRNLRYLKDRNPSCRIRLTTVLTKHNRNQMMELGRLCASVKAESITIIPLRPQVRDPAILSEMVCADDFRHVIEDLVRAQKQYGIAFTTTMETDYKQKIYRDPIVRKNSSCAAGREATNLDYDAARGEFILYACSYSPASDLQAHPELRRPFLAGSFSPDQVEQFYDIWHDSSAWRIYRDLSIRSRSCLGCTYLKSQRCTGSCPIQNIDYGQIDVSKDVLAQLKEQIRGTGEWYCYQNLT